MSVQPEIEAAIFDMDGLLIDSEPFWRRAEQEVFALVGLQLTDDQCHQTTGMRIAEVVRYWHTRFPWDDQGQGNFEVMEQAIVGRVVELVRTEGVALPGVHEVLKAAADRGLKVGLATSSAPALIDAVLDRLGLVEAFSVCCSAQHEEHGKPDPAVYLTAARKLGVEASACVAFEDSVAGVESAVRAGMRVVAVPDPAQDLAAGLQSATVILPSLLEFSFSTLT